MCQKPSPCRIAGFQTWLVASLLLCIITALSGCVSIPPEAPELSQQLGERIDALEVSHISLVRRFTDERRRQIDEFIARDWIPTFYEELMNEPEIARRFNEAANSSDPKAKGKLMLQLGPRIQAAINRKRQEMISLIDELETVIERRLRDEYLTARIMNGAITSYLVSAAEVVKNQDRTMEKLGIKHADIDAAIDKAGGLVDKLVDVRDEATDKAKQVEQFKKELEELIERLRNGTTQP